MACRKHTNYLEKAIEAKKPPKPYMYRQMTAKGWGKIENPFEFNYRLAAYCDEYNMSRAEFAGLCERYSKVYDLGIKMSSADIYNYTKCKCKPKAEKLELICRMMGAHESWVTGYNTTGRKEASVERAIVAYSAPGMSIVSEKKPDDADHPDISTKTAIKHKLGEQFKSISEVIHKADEISEILKGA